jgi:DNA-binding winged helix-turn-helix (wHTH) protein/TolB-like protein/Flp pilus assembly protein TadD
MADSRPVSVRFGPFLCDMSTGELWKAGRPIKLQEQPRHMLLALLRQPGTVLSRDQLRQQLWPDGTFVDFDNALNVGIRRLREALGDTAPTAHYVETVRGQGYRFVAPVIADREPQAESASAVPASTPSLALWMRHQRVRAAIVIVALIAGVAAALTFGRLQAELPSIESVAVLQFDNLLGDEDRQYLVDALSVAVTNRLAARRDVRVIASGSAFEAMDRYAPRPSLARRLGADALVLGSVARAGAGAVINVQLVDGVSDRILWTGRFERPIDEVLLADEIVQAVAVGIGRLAPAPSAVRVSRAVAPEARDAYLRGRFFWAKRTQPHAVTAVRYLSAAIELQRDYAEAWAGLADVYAVTRGEPSPVIVPWPGNSIDAGLLAANEALRLEPTLGEAYAALGKLYVGQRRWSAAERSFARAVDLSPQYSTARQWYGTMFARLRRCDEALDQVTQGARLDPLTPLVNEAVGSVYLACGEPSQAVELFNSVLVMHPAASTTRYHRARALDLLGRHGEAIRELEILDTAAPSDSVGGALAVSYAKAGRVAHARARLARIQAPFFRAQVFAVLGEAEPMFEMLERALTTSGSGLEGLISGPLFERYFQDARFIDLATRAGFPTPIREAQFSIRVQTATFGAR